MTSRCLLLLMAFALCACEREKREFQSGNDQPPSNLRLTDLSAGGSAAPPPDPKRQHYENNAYEISEGKRLYSWFNCSGCHAHGGGDSGPALMDDEWRYGGQLEQIFATIQQGRPNGMPSFAGKIPDQQIWQLAAYVRSMSGNLSRSASPGRSDDMANSPPEQMMEQQPPVISSPAATEGTAP